MPDPEEALKAIDARSLALSPFPFNVTLEGITDFLKQHATVRSVRMLRNKATKTFKVTGEGKMGACKLSSKQGPGIPARRKWSFPADRARSHVGQ